MIWHVTTRVGDADTFAPELEDDDPRLFFGLESDSDADGLGGLVSDVRKQCGSAPSAAAADLLIVATTAYAADLRVPRDLGTDRWTRDIRLYVPVHQPELWQTLGPSVVALLRALTGDNWEIEYRSRSWSDPVAPTAPTFETKIACLFSGGMDSFLGAIDLLGGGDRAALVGHYGAGVTGAVQRAVLDSVLEAFPESAASFRFYVQPPRPPDGEVEQSMRSRSVLFLGLGTAVASALGAKRLVVAENGLISLNVPLTAARLGTLSTRTTHPHVIGLFRELLAGLSIELTVELPYRFHTKGEMLKGTASPELAAKVATETMSCSHPESGRFQGNSPRTHCGYCVPCIIRRAAFRHANANDGDYSIDVLTRALSRSSEKSRDLRAFQIAVERFRRSTRLERVAAVLGTGPIPPEDLAQYVDTYTRGMLEVADLVDRTPRV